MPSIMVIPFYFHQDFNILLCSINRGREGAGVTLPLCLLEKCFLAEEQKNQLETLIP